MARKRFNGLKKIKIRQSWNKYNLYNISRATKPAVDTRTFYQQKWTAKSLTRQYHGEQIREKKWQQMFRPRLASVVPMDHAYLARYDGSEQAAGRGSGVEELVRKDAVPKTPYMNMVYAPMERRLDTAIFRALFASSTRQARQFVVHGAVKVNGKKMIHPGYMLNPGDMFQVDPERVLYATGARKDKYERHDGRRLKRQAEKAASSSSDGSLEEDSNAQDVEEDGPQESLEAKEEGSEDDAEETTPPSQQNQLSSLLSRARAVLQDPKKNLPAKRKRDFRAFQQAVRRAMSGGSRTTSEDTGTLDAQLTELLSKLSPSSSSSSSSAAQETSAEVSDEDRRALKLALQAARENPIDPTKPYSTPWRPREFMSAFAFIPRYLEVNQNICAAVYLRHPVARPGLAEVPAPFNPETYQLAFNWYLRRR